MTTDFPNSDREGASFAAILAPVYAHTRASDDTDEEIGDFVDAEIAAYRAERRAAKAEYSDSDDPGTPRYLTHEAIDRLNKLLGLPWFDEMQDWDIQLADAARLNEFCGLYETGDLNAEEKFALIRLIVASLDELLQVSETDSPALAQRVASFLKQDFALHFHTLEYWRLPHDSDPENVFAVTPLLRQVWGICFKPDDRDR